ncbi:MAG TPA: hypothetical protein VHO24_12425 [Opitutaceae bacterium]|nr:hypothetical protein [Opitutaceae bacterium]
MNFNDLEKTWDNQVVTGNRAITSALKHRLESEAHHERRRVVGSIVAVAFALTVGLVVTFVAHITAIKPLNPLGVATFVVGLIVDAAFFVLAARSARRIQVEIRAMGSTLAESIGASLRTIDSRIRDYRLATYALPAIPVVSTAVYFVRYLLGDFPGFGVVWSGIGMSVFVGVIILGMWRRCKNHLMPRRAELSELLTSLKETA